MRSEGLFLSENNIAQYGRAGKSLYSSKNSDISRRTAKMEEEESSVSVVVVGMGKFYLRPLSLFYSFLGPVGVATAVLLGQYGVCTLAIDKESAIYSCPRAAAIDDEAAR